MSEIKKTMVNALAFVTENGNMSADNLEAFTNQFCIKKDGTVSKPREFVKLFDEVGEVLGRRCSVTKLWFTIDNFFKDGSMCKTADKAKAKLYGESKVMEKEAEALLKEARELEDPMEKLAGFETYDLALVKAREHRLQEVTVETEGGVETIEALAEELNVAVITSAPKVEETEEVA